MPKNQKVCEIRGILRFSFRYSFKHIEQYLNQLKLVEMAIKGMLDLPLYNFYLSSIS